jgi:DNA-binding transcriptional regulator GbsR (MarR family)
MAQTSELNDFSDQFGNLMHNWGFKRIHGRIWSRLFISSRPLDAADLIEALNISKALVSISLRELLNVKAVEEVGRSSRGTNLFRANADLSSVYLEVLKQRERKMLEMTSTSLHSLTSLDEIQLKENSVSSVQMSTLSAHLRTAMTILNAYVAENEIASASYAQSLAHLSSSKLPRSLTSSMDSQNGVALPGHGD